MTRTKPHVRGVVHNQMHTPRHRAQEDDRHEETIRMYFKCGNSSMLFVKGLTYTRATTFEARINRLCREYGINLEGTFIKTH